MPSMRRPAAVCTATEAATLLVVRLTAPVTMLHCVASGEGGEGLHQLRLREGIDLVGAGVQQIIHRQVRGLLVHALVQLGGNQNLHRVAVERHPHRKHTASVSCKDATPGVEKDDFAFRGLLLGIRSSSCGHLVHHGEGGHLQAELQSRFVHVVYILVPDRVRRGLRLLQILTWLPLYVAEESSLKHIGTGYRRLVGEAGQACLQVERVTARDLSVTRHHVGLDPGIVPGGAFLILRPAAS